MSKKFGSKSIGSKALKPFRVRRTTAISRHFFGHAEKKWVTYGSTQVLVRTPTAKELKQRIQQSNAIVRTLCRTLGKPGIKIDFKSNTPLFQSDPQNPQLVVRTLGKKKTRGTFIDGVFMEVT